MQSVATSLSIGTLLLFTQAQEPNQDSRIIHLGKITCRTFTEFTRQEQDIIMAWLHGCYLPEHDPPVIGSRLGNQQFCDAHHIPKADNCGSFSA